MGTLFIADSLSRKKYENMKQLFTLTILLLSLGLQAQNEVERLVQQLLTETPLEENLQDY